MSEKQEIINEFPISIKQNAVVDYSGIERVIASVKSRIEELDIENIEATEENKSVLKELRSELNKELSDYENARKEIKKKIDEPYKEFEQVYNPLKNLYNETSNLLKDKIDEVEDRQREEKTNNLVIYFNELKTSYTSVVRELGFNLDFIGFNNLNLNITLSTSDNALRKQINEHIERIINDLKVIGGNENKARLYALYTKSLSLSQALYELQEQLKLEDEIIRNAPKVDVVKSEENKAQDQDTQAPQENVVKEIIKVGFMLEDTRENIIKVREFMRENGINYYAI